MAENIENEVSSLSASRQDKVSLMDTPFKKFFEAIVRLKGSDLHLRAGEVPKLRVKGFLKALDTPAIEVEDFEKWVDSTLTDEQRENYKKHGSLDIGVDLEEYETRFRVNLFKTRGRSAIVARRVSNEILNFDQLYLPPIMKQIAELEQGLVLLCGITGSGKSTTIASMLQYINETRPCHIVTIEDPIEYLFKDSKAVLNQREVGIDVSSFAVALRALMREDPDVVLIGEMRDKETFEAAIQAAETGHLVFGTIHASGATQAFERIYDLFPFEERDGIRNMLAYQMQAFVYQKLLPTIRDDVPRVPAVEVLLQSGPTRKLITEGREGELLDVIKNARQSGMRSFTDSLVELVDQEFIHPRVAQAAASSPEEVKMRLRGISTS